MGERFPRPLGRYSLLGELAPPPAASTDGTSSSRLFVASGGAAGDRACVVKLLDGARPGLEAAGKLRHESIVRVLDAGRDGEQAFVALELVAGRDLAALTDGGKREVPLGAALLLARDVGRGLAQAHA